MPGDTVLDLLGPEFFPTCHCFTSDETRNEHADGMYLMAQAAAASIANAASVAGLCPTSMPALAAMLVSQLLAIVAPQDPEQGLGVYLYHVGRGNGEVVRLLSLHMARVTALIQENHVVN